jgi:hypothetical protein
LATVREMILMTILPMWAYRLDRITWRVKINNTLHTAETSAQIVPGCIPEIIKIDGWTVGADDTELAYQLAAVIYDEAARTELAGSRPECPMCGQQVDGADLCQNPSCMWRGRR